MNTKTAIIQILIACGTYALSAPTLKTEVQIRLDRAVGDREFSRALSQLKTAGKISTRTGYHKSETRYFFTPQAQAAAA